MPLDYDLEDSHPISLDTFTVGVDLKDETYSIIRLKEKGMREKFEKNLAMVSRIELKHTVTGVTRAGDPAVDPIYLHPFVDHQLMDWNNEPVQGEHLGED